MIELFLRLLIALTAIVIIQTTYNALLYKQNKSIPKIGLVISMALLVVAVGVVLWLLIPDLKSIKYLGNVLAIIDMPFQRFYNYLPKWFLLLWFILPLATAWVIFVFRGGIVYLSIKRKYIKFTQSQAKQAPKESSNKHKEEVANTSPEVVEPTPTAPVLADIAPETTSKVADKTTQTARKPRTDLRVPPKKYFLDGEVAVKHFDHKSMKGLKQVVLKAKKELILGRTVDGYVGVYETKQGYKDLKKIFSKHSIDISELEPKSSIVFFNQDSVETIGLKDYIQKVKKEAQSNR